MSVLDGSSKEYRVLSHPSRRRIIELLGTSGGMGFTEIKAQTGLPVGTLYYHLDMLQGTVTQGKDKRYMLSAEGKRLYASLVAGKGLSEPGGRRTLTFLPGWLFTSLSSRLPLSLLVWAAVAATGGYLSYLAGQTLILMYPAVSVFPNWVDVVLFPASMILYALFNLGMVWMLSKRRASAGGLLSSAVALVPYLVLPALAVAIGGMDLPSLGSIYLVFAGSMQVLSLALGATYVSAAYGLRLERSLLIQMVFYVVATLAFSLLQTLGAVTPVWT